MAGVSLELSIGVIFVALSILVYKVDVQHGCISSLWGLVACISIIMLIGEIYEDKRQSRAFKILAKYTMTIFVMHTLFAASLRTVLFKVGIQNTVIHVVLGIIISFVGPKISAWIMKKNKGLEFFFDLGKFVKNR